MKKNEKGFDISHHQDITANEMKQAKEDGYTFVIIRATHGTDSVDSDIVLVDFGENKVDLNGSFGKIVNCRNWCNRREQPTETSRKVGQSVANTDLFVNGKRIVNGSTWYHDSAGYWISGYFIKLDTPERVPFM